MAIIKAQGQSPAGADLTAKSLAEVMTDEFREAHGKLPFSVEISQIAMWARDVVASVPMAFSQTRMYFFSLIAAGFVHSENRVDEAVLAALLREWPEFESQLAGDTIRQTLEGELRYSEQSGQKLCRFFEGAKGPPIRSDVWRKVGQTLVRHIGLDELALIANVLQIVGGDSGGWVRTAIRPALLASVSELQRVGQKFFDLWREIDEERSAKCNVKNPSHFQIVWRHDCPKDDSKHDWVIEWRSFLSLNAARARALLEKPEAEWFSGTLDLHVVGFAVDQLDEHGRVRDGEAPRDHVVEEVVKKRCA